MPIRTIGLGTAGGEPGLDLLHETHVTSGTQAQIDTGTLATGYSGLIVFGSLRTDTQSVVSEFLELTANGDTTATNYRYAYKSWIGSTFSDTGDGQRVASITAANGAANEFGIFHLHIPNHEGTTAYKHIFSQVSFAGNTRLVRYHLLWESTSAITQLQFDPSGAGEFIAGSRLSVWGLK